MNQTKQESIVGRKFLGYIVVLGAVALLLYQFRVEIRSRLTGGADQNSQSDRPSVTQPALEGSHRHNEDAATEKTNNVREGPMPEGSQSMEGSGTKKSAMSKASKGEIAYYTCSMHPSVKAQKPGKCPICSMDLLPVTKSELESGMIMLDARRRQLTGVKTDVVQTRNFVTQVRASGLVRYDETRLHDISLKYGGWIEELHADYTGKSLKKGDPLFTIYSPELLAAQEEFLDAIRSSKDGATASESMVTANRKRLLLLDMHENQIRALEDRGEPFIKMPVLSPADGVIIKKNIIAGGHVMPGTTLFRIADLSTVWIEADAFEFELPNVGVGQAAEISLSYRPDVRFEGIVTYIYPYLNGTTRTGRVRIEAANPDGVLKPDMYAAVKINQSLGERLAVPESAVLHAGDSRVVFLDLGDGYLKPTKISTGLRDQNFYEVLDGLATGDTIVTSGNFLIASESKLKSGIEKW